MPSLLLHICCGPCATTVIERLRDNWTVTGFFYNPNIAPETEYRLRLVAAREVCTRVGVPLIEGVYEPDRYEAAVRGFEDEPENGSRCLVCYRLRLSTAATTAAARGFDAFASTLTTGPRKKASVIDPIGAEAAREADVAFRAGDWKKRDGFNRACELAREFGIYRQHYCGCRFSIRDSG